MLEQNEHEVDVFQVELVLGMLRRRIDNVE